MKSRAEMVAERKAGKSIPDEKPTKASASERTLPLPEALYCPDCEESMDAKTLKKREDGSYECSGCAMPLIPGAAVPAKKDDPVSRTIEKKKNESTTVATRSGAYCGTCGAEWPTMNGKEMRNCGHIAALRVDDPRKAISMKSVTASGMASPPKGDVNNREVPPNVTMSVEGNRITMTWAKCIFPVGEALGVSKFANMDIGPFVIVEKFESATFHETVRRMLADLQKIADMTFDTQFVWYKVRLGLLDK